MFAALAVYLFLVPSLGFVGPQRVLPQPSVALRAAKKVDSGPTKVFEGLYSLFSQEALPPEKDEATTVVERYFAAWNRRDMASAVECFAEDCEYEDTQYASSFQGKEKLRAHLYRVAAALPTNFVFVVDDIADAGDRVGVRWHVEADGRALPFARGASMYVIDDASGKIQTGFDVPEPAPLKAGDAGLAVLSAASKFIEEPVRTVPLLCFLIYCQQLFFAENQLLPGPSALALDAATWAEVRDLSLNFWFVGPLVAPSLFPTANPVLEGVFNLVLAWSALFACFAADGTRGGNLEGEDKQANAFLPTVVGMQFLTNAFYLPYLATRDRTLTKVVVDNHLGPVERFLETNRAVPVVLGAVGLASLLWALVARDPAVYGADLPTRLDIFREALANDRLGSSFLVDLGLYAAFQSWLVPDDLERRGVPETDRRTYRLLAAVPFFGLVAYLALRPGYDDDAEAIIE